ncbi:hypothetical protein AAC387_Pa01g4445 [Persea americana]
MGKQPITSWEKMKKYMKGYFLPPTYKQTLFMRLQNLQQGNRSVDDYTEEFQYLVAHNDVMEDEDQLVERYKGGLRPSIWNVMAYHPCYTLTEAIQQASVIEESHAIEIPRSRTSIPQCSKDEGSSKKFGQQQKEDTTSGPSNQPTQMGR